MTFLRTVSATEAVGPVREMYMRSQQQLGYVPNYTKAFSLRPAVMDGWVALVTSIRSNMSLRDYELATLAAARALHSSYCMLAHGAVLAEKVFDPLSVAQIALGQVDAPLEPKEQALMAFAEKIASQANDITSSDIEKLRVLGFSDEEIFDIAATAAARCFFSKLLDALGAEPDSKFLEMNSPLRSALATGRPISHEPVEIVEPAQ